MLEEVLGDVEVDRALIEPDSGKAPKAPGMKYKHYAPRGELVIVEGKCDRVVAGINEAVREKRARGMKTGVICTDETKAMYDADSVKSTGSRCDEQSTAKELFRILREFDDEQVAYMYAESWKDGDLGQAIMNRLMKAAGHRVVRTDEGETLHFK
jgi:L-threonylcarbamoyladenylate synthase